MVRHPVIPLAAVALCVVTVCGCTSGSSGVKTQDPTVTTTTSASASDTGPPTSDSGTPTTPSTTSTKPRPPSEAATRRAVAAAWARFYSIYGQVETPAVPAAKRPALVAKVAVNPVYDQVLTEAANFSKVGVSAFGYEIHHPYWPTAVAGKSTVVMGDCMDSSHAGSKLIKTGLKRTVGVKIDNTRATLVYGADHVWRVRSIEYLVDAKCTP